GFTVVQGIRGGARAWCIGNGIGARTWSIGGERACRPAGFPRMASGAAKDWTKTWVLESGHPGVLYSLAKSGFPFLSLFSLSIHAMQHGGESRSGLTGTRGVRMCRIASRRTLGVACHSPRYGSRLKTQP
ncbi:MAG: hypothetical protein VB141_03210, partial [Burkholderia gladioli]